MRCSCFFTYLDCIGVLFLRSAQFFRLFHVNQKSNWSGNFSHDGEEKGAREQVG